ncbi:hypothetical protein C5B73_01310 [Nocardia cyriacigeorgica]|nr:hypothetical protein C5B73_01310 [Nocardia cyriacigeorgica]
MIGDPTAGALVGIQSRCLDTALGWDDTESDSRLTVALDRVQNAGSSVLVYREGPPLGAISGQPRIGRVLQLDGVLRLHIASTLRGSSVPVMTVNEARPGYPARVGQGSRNGDVADAGLLLLFFAFFSFPIAFVVMDVCWLGLHRRCRGMYVRAGVRRAGGRVGVVHGVRGQSYLHCGRPGKYGCHTQPQDGECGG